MTIPTTLAFLNSAPLPSVQSQSLLSSFAPKLSRLPTTLQTPRPILISKLSNSRSPATEPPPSKLPPLSSADNADTNNHNAEEQVSPPSQRLFSNLSQSSEGVLQHADHSEIAATLLVAGTMIGAGVLALPSVAKPSGFVPSSTALLAVWAYMAATGLLISEVTIATACATGRVTSLSMMSLAKETLGRFGTTFTTFTYALLHYAILTAYTAQTGTLLSTHLFPKASQPDTVSSICGAIFLCGMGIGMLRIPSKTVSTINNVLVTLAGISFLSVLGIRGLALQQVSQSLSEMHWGLVGHGALIPVLFVSCVYHNVVTGVTIRLEGDRRKIQRALLLGSGIPVLMFILYDAVMLMTVAHTSSVATDSEWAVSLFSLLAIATSVVGFIEGLSSFVADGRRRRITKEEEGSEEEEGVWINYAMCVIPPTMFAAIVPDAFFNALDVAGTYGIAGLFGTVPALMAWNTRRREDMQDFEQMVAGGNATLALIAAIPMLLIVGRLLEAFNLHLS